MKGNRALACGLAALLSLSGARAAEPAALAVRGLGLIGDRVMRNRVLLLLGSERGAVLRPPALEDAALVIYSGLAEDGYLEAEVRVKVRTARGTSAVFPIGQNLEGPMPRSLEAAAAVFEIRRRRRFTVHEVRFTGLSAMRPGEAADYFRGEGVLASFTSERAYSPRRLKRSAGNLLDELRRRGYAEAGVSARAERLDRATGRVWIRVDVRQGPLWLVKGAEIRTEDGSPAPALDRGAMGRPWSEGWKHDAEAALRRGYYARGRPDVRIDIVPRPAPESGGERAVIAMADIRPGPFVRLGQVRFVGLLRTRGSILRPLVRAKPGGPLDPILVQDGLARISRLGIFSSADSSYEPPFGPVRDAVYSLQEGRKQNVDGLFGWGSFEELRGGVEWHDRNLFGLAHEGSLKFVQSLKSTDAEYDYTVPEVFGTSADATAKVFGFKRQERALVDEQYGGNLSATTQVRPLGADLLAGYTYVNLGNSKNTLATELTDPTHAAATSVQLGLSRDRRDNPLDPRHGYKLTLNLVEASRRLGGQVDFQEAQLGASYHVPLGLGRWLHLGFTHSVITKLGAPAGNVLPPTVLLYPGGEDSIRGYGEGQAAARDPTGHYLGVRTLTLLDVELEQALTSKLSVVVFEDSLGASATLAHYPFGYRLYSAGLGLRYRTIVGPVRLEYGRNLNRRDFDPIGALQFSVGFPF